MIDRFADEATSRSRRSFIKITSKNILQLIQKQIHFLKLYRSISFLFYMTFLLLMTKHFFQRENSSLYFVSLNINVFYAEDFSNKYTSDTIPIKSLEDIQKLINS